MAVIFPKDGKVPPRMRLALMRAAEQHARVQEVVALYPEV
jgi:hypothetical protein